MTGGLRRWYVKIETILVRNNVCMCKIRYFLRHRVAAILDGETDY